MRARKSVIPARGTYVAVVKRKARIVVVAWFTDAVAVCDIVTGLADRCESHRALIALVLASIRGILALLALDTGMPCNVGGVVAPETP